MKVIWLWEALVGDSDAADACTVRAVLADSEGIGRSGIACDEQGAIHCADGSLCAGRSFVFPGAAHVQECEDDLHHHDCAGLDMPAPDHP